MHICRNTVIRCVSVMEGADVNSAWVGYTFVNSFYSWLYGNQGTRQIMSLFAWIAFGIGAIGLLILFLDDMDWPT